MRAFYALMVLVMVVLMGAGVQAQGIDFTDPCYGNTVGVTVYFGSVQDPLVIDNFGIANDCASGSYVKWKDTVNLTVLGDVLDNEVVVTSTFVYVDIVARPDLQGPATLVFRQVPFAVEPAVLKDGTLCLSPQCNATYYPGEGRLVVEVGGFSNYSLSGRQDFTVYSDTAPELDNKVYQTIDLGDSRRGQEYACIVQIFGRSMESPGQWVLVQTNPEREVQGKLLGNPDPNQPESLGYFRTTGGLSNVYFRDQNIPGYADFEYVAQCSSNTSKLIYEEPISTRYHPMGRNLAGRGVWLAQGDNALYIVMWVVLIFIGGLLVVKIFRMVFYR